MATVYDTFIPPFGELPGNARIRFQSPWLRRVGGTTLAPVWVERGLDTAGTFSVTLPAGPYDVTLTFPTNNQSMKVRRIVVPDDGSHRLSDLLDVSVDWPPAVVGQAQAAALQAAASAAQAVAIAQGNDAAIAALVSGPAAATRAEVVALGDARYVQNAVFDTYWPVPEAQLSDEVRQKLNTIRLGSGGVLIQGGMLTDRMRPAARTLSTATFATASTQQSITGATTAAWNSTGKFRVLGGTLVQGSSASWGKVTADGSSALSAYEIEFQLYGDRCSVQLNLPDAGGGDVHVYVDGQPCTATTSSITSTGTQYINLSFGSVGQRTVRVSLGRAQLGGVIIPAAGFMWPAPQRYRIAVTGDSWAAGSAQASGNLWCGSIAHWLGVRAGFEVFRLGQPGTGFINNGSGNNSPTTGTDTGAVGGRAALGHQSRMDALAALPADTNVLIVMAGAADSTFDQTVIRDQALQFFQSVKQARPAMRIVVVSPPPTMLDATKMSETWLSVKAAAASAGSMLGSIDTRAAAWITGTGREGATNGSGNRDWVIAPDGWNPSRAGAQYLGERIVDEISRMVY